MSFINWGVLAPGRIAVKFAKALGHLEDNGYPVHRYAVASRESARAEDFADKNGFEKAYGSYAEMLADEELDAVYVASPHAFHKEQSVMALNAGKAVVCEKPAAVNGAQLEEVTGLAARRNLFYMEAMWTAFNPCVKAVMGKIRDGAIGKVKEIEATFCYRNAYNPHDRLFDPNLAGGALLDMGIYPVTFAMLATAPTIMPAIGGESNTCLPRKVVSLARIENCVDLGNSAVLLFADGIEASLRSAIDYAPNEHSNDAYIYGDKGCIYVPQFHYAQSALVYTYAKDVGTEAHGTEEINRPFMCNGYEYEIIEATDCILEGKTQAGSWTWADCAAVCSVLDSMRAQWGLLYPFEA